MDVGVFVEEGQTKRLFGRSARTYNMCCFAFKVIIFCVYTENVGNAAAKFSFLRARISVCAGSLNS